MYFSGSAIEWLPDEGAKGLVAKKDRPLCSPPGVSVDMTMSTNPDRLKSNLLASIHRIRYINFNWCSIRSYFVKSRQFHPEI